MSTGSSHIHNQVNDVKCYCGIRSPICSSNKPWNKGGKFYECSQVKEKKCNFFQWLENGEGCENVVEDWKDQMKTMSQASDFCPQKVVHDDKGQELNQGQHNAPAPVVPSEPYGPWMLVERRRRRPNTKAEPSPKQSNLVSTTNSRYNPIFIENNDDLHLDAQMDASPQLETQFELRQSNGLDDSGKENINPSNGVKAKGKQTLLICTPHALALASKNGASVTYSRKVGSNVATSCRARKVGIHIQV
ncbi:hypothetical protein V6N13_125552 [Hibiscus sabdariffa]